MAEQFRQFNKIERSAESEKKEEQIQIRQIRSFVFDFAPTKYDMNLGAVRAERLKREWFRRSNPWIDKLPEGIQEDVFRCYYHNPSVYDSSKAQTKADIYVASLERGRPDSRRGTKHLDILFALITGEVRRRAEAFSDEEIFSRPEVRAVLDEQGLQQSELAKFEYHFKPAFDDFASFIFSVGDLRTQIDAIMAEIRSKSLKQQGLESSQLLGKEARKKAINQIAEENRLAKVRLKDLQWQLDMALAARYLIPNYATEFEKWKQGRKTETEGQIQVAHKPPVTVPALTPQEEKEWRMFERGAISLPTEKVLDYEKRLEELKRQAEKIEEPATVPGEEALREEFDRENLERLLRRTFTRLVRRTNNFDSLKQYDPKRYRQAVEKEEEDRKRLDEEWEKVHGRKIGASE